MVIDREKPCWRTDATKVLEGDDDQLITQVVYFL